MCISVIQVERGGASNAGVHKGHHRSAPSCRACPTCPRHGETDRQLHDCELLYSRKYWWELNLVVEPKIAIARILADLNLAVRYGIAIRIIYYMRVGNFGRF